MITLIFNPTARGEKSKAFLAALKSLGQQAVLKPTRCAGDAITLAKEAVEEGSTTVVAAGGDGTVNEVVNGLAATTEGLRRTRLGVLPLGTVNVFARELRIPADFSAAWKVIASGAERVVDLPHAEMTGAQGLVHRYFVQMAGAGLDSRAIGLVSWELKKKIGPLAYLWACAQAMRQPMPKVRVYLDGQMFESPLVCVGNGRFLGGSFPFFPHARLDDGKLDVVAFKEMKWLTLVRLFPRLLMDRFHSSRDAHFLQTTDLRLESGEAMSLHLEGDNVGFLPANIGLIRGGLRVCAPARD
ncbi:MAG TPA: diacylglycerol kinase family protein [Candidatus Limnocylindria bacterium]|nr:diacylglycerol kinase family protein [Candidatus Limnocylindria bacterium]